MIGFVARRMGATLVVLFIVSVLAFVLMRVVPGDPARLVLGPLAGADAVAALRAQMGLGDSIGVQYVRYVQGLLSGDWGTAWHIHEPVTQVFGSRLPATIELALAASLIGAGVGLPLGAMAARRRGGLIDKASTAFAVLAVGTPTFWLGVVLILVLYADLHLVGAPFGQLSTSVTPPRTVTGMLVVDAALAGNGGAFLDGLGHLVLPALTLGFPFAGYITRIMRQSVLSQYGLEYIRAARAKGLSEHSILVRHAVPNALLPVLTLVTLSIGDLLAGSVLVETVFNWPGVGGFVTESIGTQDFAPVQAAIVLAALTYCILNLLTDLAYAVIDPRVRLQEA